MNASSDLAIIGAGPAGLAAALAAAKAGVSVVLIDSAPRPGGQYFKQLPASFSGSDSLTHQGEVRQITEALAHHNVTLLMDTVVWDCHQDESDWLLYLFGTTAPKRLRARSIVAAPGAYDRPVAFPGWTLPGVFTTGAVQNLIKSQRVLPGKDIVVSGTGPLTLAVAANLVKAGANVRALLEASPIVKPKTLSSLTAMWAQWARLREGLDYVSTLLSARVPVRIGWAVVEARGRQEVEEVVIAPLGDDWRPDKTRQQVMAADTLVVGYGFTPNTDITRLLGCRHARRHARGEHIPWRDRDMQTSVPGVFAAGDGAGIGGSELARLEGHLAGCAAAVYLGRMPRLELERLRVSDTARLARERRFAAALDRLFTPGSGFDTLADDNTVICRCEQVRLREIQAAVASGARTANEVKGLTRAGMGNCQGRICGSLVARAIAGAGATTEELDSVGSFTPRPPLVPLPLTVLAEALP